MTGSTESGTQGRFASALAGGAVRSRRTASCAGIVASAAGLLLVAVIASMLGASWDTDASAAATAEIPPSVLAAYQDAADVADIPWEVLAGIGAVQTNHGRTAPGETFQRADPQQPNTPVSSNPSGTSSGGGDSPRILSRSVLTTDQVVAWYRATGEPYEASVPLETLVDDYARYGTHYGVRWDIAFAQATVETGWFTNRDTTQRNNFAGYGHCDTCPTGTAFPTAADGVRTQILALRSAAADDIPAAAFPPGTAWRLPGCCPAWDRLTHTWASSSNYGDAIRTRYGQMLATAGRTDNGSWGPTTTDANNLPLRGVLAPRLDPPITTPGYGLFLLRDPTTVSDPQDLDLSVTDVARLVRAAFEATAHSHRLDPDTVGDEPLTNPNAALVWQDAIAQLPLVAAPAVGGDLPGTAYRKALTYAGLPAPAAFATRAPTGGGSCDPHTLDTAVGLATSTAARTALRAACSQLGVVYQWGAEQPRTARGAGAFDCSGLTQWAYAQAQVPLARVTYDQASQGVAVVSLAAALPGDLVFLDANGHVGIYLGNNKILHAPHTGDVVRISPVWSTPSAIRRVA